MSNANSSHGDYDLNMGRERLYNCKAKSLLYGGDTRPVTPVNKGKRVVPHNPGHGTPFATYDADILAQVNPTQSKTFTAKGKGKDGAGKVTGKDFDPEIYKQAIIDNAANMSKQKAKNWKGTGNIFGATQPSTNNKVEETYADDADDSHHQGYQQHYGSHY